MDELFQFLQTLHSVSPDLMAALYGRFQKENFRKNKMLLRCGDTCDWIAFVEKGLVRMCYDIPNGGERIVNFVRAGEAVFAINSFFCGQPSRVSIVSMDETVIRKIRKAEIEAVCRLYPTFHQHIRQITAIQSVMIEAHYMMLTLSAYDRMVQFYQSDSWILKDRRIKQYMIADFIGVDRATLSRWRKEGSNSNKRYPL